MAVYRYQVTSVGYWRGKIHRWSTTFYETTQNRVTSIRNAMQKSGWKNPGDVVGACSGGVASIKVYNVAGGAPISTTEYFDWQTPGTWIPYTSEGWASVDPDTPIDASGESALVVVGHFGALSSSGKPITTRKYLHAVPSRTAADYSDPDISATDQAVLAGYFSTADMARPNGSAAASVTVEPYYFNHQRVRGRRRTATQVAEQSFSAGVVLGAGSAGGVGPLVA